MNLAQAGGLDFSQFGVFGTILAVLAVAVGVLWKRETSAHDRALKRIEQLEAALEKRNTEDRERLEAAQTRLHQAQAEVEPRRQRLR